MEQVLNIHRVASIAIVQAQYLIFFFDKSVILFAFILNFAANILKRKLISIFYKANLKLLCGQKVVLRKIRLSNV